MPKLLTVGLVGEDPNDKEAIKVLLLQKYNTHIKFIHLLKNVKGYYLDNKSTQDSLKIEFKSFNPNLIIFIRDTDGLITETAKTRKVHDWFNKLNKAVNNKGILLCNIYELEALILADIITFNREYGTSLKNQGDVTFKKDPKGFLIKKTEKLSKTYRENHCPELFGKLKIDTIEKNCTYFKKFLQDFEKRIKQIA